MKKIILSLSMVFIVIGLSVSSLVYLQSLDDGHQHDSTHAPLEVGDDADIYGPNLKGQTIRASRLGAKIVMINFWATWCPPCLNELPSIVKLRKQYSRQDLEILGINLDQDPPNDVPPALKKYGIEFPVIFDPENRITDRFGIEGIPVSVFITRDGTVLHRENGDRDWSSSEVKEQIDQWLKDLEQLEGKGK